MYLGYPTLTPEFTGKFYAPSTLKYWTRSWSRRWSCCCGRVIQSKPHQISRQLKENACAVCTRFVYYGNRANHLFEHSLSYTAERALYQWREASRNRRLKATSFESDNNVRDCFSGSFGLLWDMVGKDQLEVRLDFILDNRIRNSLTCATAGLQNCY